METKKFPFLSLSQQNTFALSVQYQNAHLKKFEYKNKDNLHWFPVSLIIAHL